MLMNLNLWSKINSNQTCHISDLWWIIDIGETQTHVKHWNHMLLHVIYYEYHKSASNNWRNITQRCASSFISAQSWQCRTEHSLAIGEQDITTNLKSWRQFSPIILRQKALKVQFMLHIITICVANNKRSPPFPLYPGLNKTVKNWLEWQCLSVVCVKLSRLLR